MRGVEQAELAAIGDNADRDAALPEQAFELGDRWIMPGAGDLLGFVEGEAGAAWVLGREVPQQGDVGATGAGGGGQLGVIGELGWGLEVAQRERRAQGLAALGDVEGEVS